MYEQCVYIRYLFVDAAENDHGRFILLLFYVTTLSFIYTLDFYFKMQIRFRYEYHVCWQILLRRLLLVYRAFVFPLFRWLSTNQNGISEYLRFFFSSRISALKKIEPLTRLLNYSRLGEKISECERKNRERSHFISVTAFLVDFFIMDMCFFAKLYLPWSLCNGVSSS